MLKFERLPKMSNAGTRPSLGLVKLSQSQQSNTQIQQSNL